jgi:hypothetical protein
MRRFLFILLCAGLFLVPFAAARAEDPFTVKDVTVQASGASATEAFNVAVDGGRRAAWKILVHRLVPDRDWSQVPGIDGATLKRMVSGYRVSNEKRSTTRYMADVTYTFNGDLVRRFLQGAGIAYAASAARPLLVIPLAPSYLRASDWTEVWSGTHVAGDSVPLVLPVGDALDSSILKPIDFGVATWSDIQPVASRVHASQAALVLVERPSSQRMTIRIRILSPAAPQTLAPVEVTLAPDTPPLTAYGQAMNAASQAIADAWKARSAIDFNRRSTLTAQVRIDSLAQWGAIQQRLATVPVVTHVNVAAMTLGQAQLVIDYAGTQSQLDDFFSQAALSLSNRDGVWWLSAQSGDGGMVSQ